MLSGGVLIVDSPGFLANTGLGFPIPAKSLSRHRRQKSPICVGLCCLSEGSWGSGLGWGWEFGFRGPVTHEKTAQPASFTPRRLQVDVSGASSTLGPLEEGSSPPLSAGSSGKRPGCLARGGDPSPSHVLRCCWLLQCLTVFGIVRETRRSVPRDDANPNDVACR